MSPTEKRRLSTAQRAQVELVPRSLEGLLPPEHEARAVWLFVERMDLSKFYEGIQAVEGGAGRAATDPKVLVALLLYGMTQGIGSAREIERLTESHDAYRWLRGGVPLNHHLLSDFRVKHQGALDKLLMQSIAVLLDVGAIGLERVAQDGTRIRASAGAASFRRKGSLERCLVEAQEQLEWVKRNEEGASDRERAAQERAARERAARVEEALAQLPEIQQRRDEARNKQKVAKQGEVRVSTTDPDSRVMKMADGGYRPAYNFQFATDAKHGCVVGVRVTNSPADQQQLMPMVEDVTRRCGDTPAAWLVDAGYTTAANVSAADAVRTVLYGPILTSKEGRETALIPRKTDSPAMALFRLRMASEEGKQMYRERARVAELTNAEVKHRFGVDGLLVRGLEKVTCIALWAGLACNVMKLVSLGWL